MFPLHQGGELCFKISSSPHQQDNIPQDLILAHQYAEIHGSDITNNMEKGRRRNITSMDNDEAARDNNMINSKKKMMHRDIERQRRQEMATLHASLRALLPHEFIKGKRSISDHMNEAVNYIKYLQKKIKETSAKRDKLKKLSDLSSVASPSGCSNKYSSSSVALQPYPGGIEITFDSDLMGRDLPVSRVLQVLLEEGISVINCVSTKVNERLFHSVQTEVNDPTCLNLSELWQKLTLVVSSTSDLSK
ncbi:PREDICTED: transcription factor bHLH118-like [Populus euphratica]|uniref:Transcription factor bHLH118-like n=1 Tax=Populus euphratica TaxID=75702 RepID=A0AAJ6V698_POPEU|nr:PREDICTED: transcription factor bHLH118-like [Populus euphratica]